MKFMSDNPKQRIIETGHFLATGAWALIFAAALSTGLSGQTTSGTSTWNPNQTTSTATSTIPLPKDPFTGALIFAVSLTAALFSSWVIPEGALTITDKVLALSNRSPKPIEPAIDQSDNTTPEIKEPESQTRDRLIDFMHKLAKHLLFQAVKKEQEALDNEIEKLQSRGSHLAKVRDEVLNLLERKNQEVSEQMNLASELQTNWFKKTVQQGEEALNKAIENLQQQRDQLGQMGDETVTLIEQKDKAVFRHMTQVAELEARLLETTVQQEKEAIDTNIEQLQQRRAQLQEAVVESVELPAQLVEEAVNLPAAQIVDKILQDEKLSHISDPDVNLPTESL